MNKKDKEVEYQKGIDELYNKTYEFGRVDFVKMIFDLKNELDIANKKLDKIKECLLKNKVSIFENRIYKGEDYQIDGDDILSIIGSD